MDTDNKTTWQRHFDEAAEYHAREGQWPAQNTGLPIATWLANQRMKHRRGDLAPEHTHALTQIDPDWAGLSHEQTWQRRFEAAKAHYAEHGRWPLTRSGSTYDPTLGSWLNSQRRLAATGTIPAHRREALEAVDPNWAGKPHTDWSTRFDEACAFRAEHGRWPGLREGTPTDLRNGWWLYNQRRVARVGTLSADRLAAFEAVDADWQSPVSSVPERLTGAWSERAAQAAAFHAEHGRLPNYREGTTGDPTVGSWLNTQRAAARDGKLSAERRAVLDGIDAGWEGRTQGA